MNGIPARQQHAPYAVATASMPADAAAGHTDGAASASSFRRFPIETAGCARHPILGEWVPDREQRVVPGGMAAVCRGCPGRPACLRWALAAAERGYWAATTSQDRARMRQVGVHSVEAADRLQQQARHTATAGARHRDGDGGYRWYRRGCRCTQCKTANAARRAQERAKSRCAHAA